MAISMKGIFRGLKIIAQIFTAQREHEIEIEIGYPTDVRHVSHVGFGASGSCPSWMSEFRGAEEVAGAGGGGGASISSAVQSRQTSWASLDFEQPPAEASTADISAARDAGAGAPRGAAPPPKRPAAKPKKARAPSPGSSARSSSWRSTASSAAARTDSDEPPDRQQRKNASATTASEEHVKPATPVDPFRTGQPTIRKRTRRGLASEDKSLASSTSTAEDKSLGSSIFRGF